VCGSVHGGLAVGLQERRGSRGGPHHGVDGWWGGTVHPGSNDLGQCLKVLVGEVLRTRTNRANAKNGNGEGFLCLCLLL
jgi:hypothetical protein